MPSPFCRVACFSLLALSAPAALACSGSLHIEIENAGVYALGQAEIVAVAPGLADCPRESLQLTKGGQPVPMRLTGSGPTLQPGDRIEWVGLPLHGPESWFNTFSTVNVYVLGTGAAPAARIQEVAAVATGAAAPLQRRLHLEQENLMIRLNQSHVQQWQEADFWHWAKLTHVDPQPFAVDLELPDLVAGAGNVRFKLKFRGMSVASRMPADKPVDHIVQVQLDAKQVAEFRWDGRDEVVHEFSLPAAALRDKGSRLSLSVPKRPMKADEPTLVVDVVMFNSLDLDYPVRGDLARASDSLHVAATGKVSLDAGGRHLAVYSRDGRRWQPQGAELGRIEADTELFPVLDDAFAVPQKLRPIAQTDWHKPAEPIDYIMISHSRLIDAVKPLAEFHRARGLKVALIDVDEVYDQFNHGIVHPQAIRNLMSQAYREWPEPRPRYALLVGDASFDIRHQRINRLNVAKWADMELLAPGHFGDIDSTPYAETPHLKHRALIPTWQFMSYDGQSASDNRFVSVGEHPLHPVIAMGRFPVVEPAEVTAIVDKTIKYMSSPQLGGWRRDVMFITDESDYFKSTSDQIAASLDAEGFLSDKVYASKDEKDNLAHQSTIKDGLNDGRLLVHFIGHGGRYIWRTGPPDLRKNHDLFTLNDVSALSNGGRLPMVLSMTCYSAPFDNPTEDSIGERFLREPERGAIAVFAASWRNSPTAEYSKAIVSELVKPGRTIGESIVAGKSAIQDVTLVETYNLLGDPAVILERPEGEFRLVRKARPFGPDAIEAQVQRDGLRGMAEASWLDKDGRQLHSARFAVLGTRFLLPDPPADVLRDATEVRGYVADRQRPFDAIARLQLVASPAAQPEPALSPESLEKLELEKQDAAAAQASPVQTHSAAAVGHVTEEVTNRGDVVRRSGFDRAPGSAGATPAGAATPNVLATK